MLTIVPRDSGEPVVVDDFTAGYLEAALWSSMDGSTPQGGEPLDKNYEFSDIASDSLHQMVTDCKLFQEKFGHLITEENETKSRRECTVQAYAGHDFWLTREGHGCGFWDGDWEKKVGLILTEASKGFKPVDLYVGDDNLIHAST